MVTQIKRLVIIGCAGAGGPAAMMAKRLDSSLEVTLIREEENFLVRCAVPYICAGDCTVESSVKDESVFHNVGTKLVNSRATDIDRAHKTVTVEDGSVYSYDKLVLATGASPSLPPIPGIDLDGVFTVRTSRDAQCINEWIAGNSVRKAMVIGAGAIGLEIAALLSTKGIGTVVVEMLDHVFPSALDVDMAAEVEEYLRGQGLDLRLQQRISRITGDNKVAGVELSSGEKIEAETVILAGGIKPRLELAEAAGLEVGKLGLKVNKYLQTSDQDIYAAGDMIEFESMSTGKPVLGQLRPNAVIGGRVIAMNALGYQIEFPKLVNTFATKLMDLSLGATGITEEFALQEGMEIVCAKRSARSKHAMIEGGKPFTVKLIFDRKSQTIVGGQIVGYSEVLAKQIDVLGTAIKGGMTALDLTTLRCAGQPELSPEPGAEPISLAAGDAFLELTPRPS